jgi:site-specific DNA-methyltransferase (adenine-specific)
LRIPNILGNKKHPTEKPSSLMGILVTNSSNAGDVVLDPFMGAGSCGVACLETGRKFIGIEIDKNYYDIAVERIKEVE